MSAPTLVSYALFFGQPVMIACDARCEKAWGINARPRRGDVSLTDDELGIAPTDPGTYEGADAKPTDARHNKWCARECERSDMVRLVRPLRLFESLARALASDPDRRET